MELLSRLNKTVKELPPIKRLLFAFGLTLAVSFVSFFIVSGAYSLFNKHFFIVHTVTNSDIYGSFVCKQEPVKSISELKRGDYVYFHYHGKKQFPQYGLVDGAPLVKMVWGLPGDEVKIDGKYVYINGQIRAAVLKTDRWGHPVDYFHFAGKVPKNKLFLLAPHPRSFDSRYWGFADLSWGIHKCWALPLSDLPG